MCGIAGIVTTAPDIQFDMSDKLRQMTDSMAHRGPDDEGCYLSNDRRLGFVNCRLAIRDLSAAGHMPMANADGTIWITYNGEIYNMDELRQKLQHEGLTFLSNSDTEVILKGYEAWGNNILGMLRGMFALAIHDQKRNQLLLARDPLGIKPLYYANLAGMFLFASEIKTILASKCVSKNLNPAGLIGYLAAGSVPSPMTIYQDIYELEAGHSLVIQLDDISLNPVRYWHFPAVNKVTMNASATVERVREWLLEAVRSHLVSDVPLGAFLSGGLDSSAIVALMRQASNGTIRTCSMVFEEATYSEANYARSMAQHVGAEHFERIITGDDVAREFDNVLQAMDEPTIDGFNTYFVAQTARQAGLAVALSGLGGDELFGGYPNTFFDVPHVYRALQWVNRVPGGRRLAQAVIPQNRYWSRIHDALNYPPTRANAYTARRGVFAESEVKALVAPEIWQAGTRDFNMVDYVARRADTAVADDMFAWISRAELGTYTHDQLLRDTDVMSMAHSLEVRVPLLDIELVNRILSLPSVLKTKYGIPKPLLVKAVQPYLPPEIASRKHKQGFTFPFDVWLRGCLKNTVMERIRELQNKPFINSEQVEKVVHAYENRQIHWSRLWSLVVLANLSVTS
jgi:asparagine synthase (glutamine-hydrolysing)